MITIYKRQTNKDNYIKFCCDTNDLTELNSNYLDAPNGSKAYILGTRDYYEYNKGNSEWVLVEVGSGGGSGGDIDTSKFVTKSGLATTLLNYVTNSDLSTELASYVTSTDLGTTLEDYVTSSSLSSTLSGYATTSDIVGVVKRTAYTNITVETSSCTTYETNYYKAEIPINGVTSTDDVIVNFSFNSIVSNDLMGIASTDTNKVIIYATSAVLNTVTIDSIFIDSVVTS